jgi:hypothetical protein
MDPHALSTDSENRRDASALLIRQIHSLVADYLEPRLWIYWIDFLVTMALGCVGFWWFTHSRSTPALKVLGFVVAGFAFYRATAFTHELTHHRHGAFRYFRIAWNMLCGIPFLLPSFLYNDHKGHHVNHSYGTPEDAEYLPLGTGTLTAVAGYFAQVLFVPLLTLLRFLVFAPLSWLIPPLRRVVWERFSSLGKVNWSYRRAVPESASERREALVQEGGCFLYGVGLIVLIGQGVIPWKGLLQIFAVILFATAINYIRALGSHRYLNDGRRLSYLEQLLDSTTVPGHPLLTELWAPLGLRYHALHHVVPSLPYHNMGLAHRRLMALLPADSPYRATIRTGLADALGAVLWPARHLTGRSEPV